MKVVFHVYWSVAMLKRKDDKEQADEEKNTTWKCSIF